MYLHLSLPPWPFSQPVLHLFKKEIFGATTLQLNRTVLFFSLLPH